MARRRSGELARAHQDDTVSMADFWALGASFMAYAARRPLEERLRASSLIGEQVIQETFGPDFRLLATVVLPAFDDERVAA